MSFQKCPICNGSGNDLFIVTGSFTNYPCPTCKGTRIIDEVTGLPPIIEEKHNIFEPVDPYRDKIGSTQTSTQTPTQNVSHIQGDGS